MRILVTGGTGLIGKALVQALLADNANITVLTRRPNALPSEWRNRVDGIDSLDGMSDLNSFDAVINLAGEPIVNKRWSEAQKRVLEASRWAITEQLTALIKASDTPPHTFISGSAIGIYGRQDDTRIDESFRDFHDEYSRNLCLKWEQAAMAAQSDLTRVCILRTGIVLAPNGGALEKMRLPFLAGAGGPIGKGDHGMSWIHIDDMVAGIAFLLSQPACQGEFNFTAPNPVSNKAFSQAFARALHRPCLLTTPRFALRLAMGEMADLLLFGQYVIPVHLQDSGYRFLFTDINDAMRDVVAKRK